jgi:hypothetical protein
MSEWGEKSHQISDSMRLSLYPGIIQYSEN